MLKDNPSLRFRVFLGISLISIAVLAIVGYRAFREWELRLDYARSQVLNSARLLAATQNDLVQYTIGLIDSLAQLAAIGRLAASDECPRELARELANSAHFAGISVLQPNGDVACSAEAPSTAFEIAGGPYFQKALASSKLVIGEALYGNDQHRFALPFYKSVVSDNHVVGVVVVLVDLSSASQDLAKSNYPEGTRVGLVDTKGALLALHPVPATGWTARDISSTGLYQALTNGPSEYTFVEQGLDNVARIYGTARFADTDAGPLSLFVSIPRSVALTEVQRDFAAPLGLTLGLIVLTFLVAAQGVDRLFLQPARALSLAARRFTAGDTSARTGIAHTTGEIGQLAQSFDAMADSIESEKRQAAVANRALHQLDEALRRIPAAIAYIDAAERCLYANKAYEAWFGLGPDRLGTTLRETLDTATYSAVQSNVEAALHGEARRFEMSFTDADGAVRQASVSYIPDVGPDGIAGFFIFANDITDHKRQAEAFAKLAYVDSLTGLPNRLTFLELLEQAHKRAQREGTGLAVIFIDLDGLKEINDTEGHATGDAVLKAFAHKVKAAVRAVDIVARLGGDEFTVLIDNLRGADAVPAIVDKLEAALRVPSVVAGQPRVISASMGVAERHAADTTPEELLAEADAAMYRAKNRRKANG